MPLARLTALLLGARVAAAAVDAAAAGGPPATGDDAPFLSRWMGEFASIWSADTTLLDVSVPGTHDSLTFDLSTTISDRAEDVPEAVAWLFHTFSGEVPGLTGFARNQSSTQTLNATAQLDAGVRFIDFRIQFTRPPEDALDAAAAQAATAGKGQDWYGLHMMETNQPASSYLQDVHAWMVAHPTEVVAVWISRHGSECNDHQYDDVPVEAKWQWWRSVEALFGPMLVDHAAHPVNETGIAGLVEAGQRLVVYLADAANFTNSSSRALNCCQIDNVLGAGITNLTHGIPFQIARAEGDAAAKQRDKLANKYLLESRAAGGDSATILGGFYQHFFSKLAPAIDKACVEDMHVPNSTFCPQDLKALGRMGNYYTAKVLDYVANRAAAGGVEDFPNAFYIDVVGPDGVIMVGNAPYATDEHANARYAYADTVLYVTLQKACLGRPGANATRCAELNATLTQRRARHPLTLWDDPSTARWSAWPPMPDDDQL